MGHDHAHIPLNNGKMNMKASLIAVSVALTLLIAKIYGYRETDSVSIFSSLVDSALDIGISLINFIAIRYALKPADEDHPYGHTAIEDIVGLLQSMVIFFGCGFILAESMHRFLFPEEVKQNMLGINIMIFSIVLTFALVIYQRFTIRRTKSIVVEADSLHYTSDLLSGILIIVSLYLTENPSLNFVDPVLAVLIALYIGRDAIKIGLRAFNNLMDKEISEEDKKKIIGLIEQNKKHNGYHDLKTRHNGNKIFVQFDLEMDGDLPDRKSVV